MLRRLRSLKRRHCISAPSASATNIAKFSGSMAFVWFHVIWFSLWILANEKIISVLEPFDPFPFSLLTMIVSLEAIFLSTFVLISQNRASQQADKRAHLDLQVNLLAEQEMTTILELLKRLCEHQGLTLEDGKVERLAAKTDVRKVAKALDRDLPEQR